MATKKLSVTLIKSLNGRLLKHKECARGLGLTRIRQNVEVIDTVENRGMVNKIRDMVEVIES